jgi:outer membrane lipoprotein-sorting protein
MRTAALRLALFALLPVVPAIAPAQDGDEAKKLFQAMEERLAKAKSISLNFSIEVAVEGKTVVAVKGSLASARGDQARFESEGKVEGQDDKVTLTSDGKRMRYILMIGKKVIKDRETSTPKNLSTALARALSRPGLLLGSDSLEIDSDRERELNASKLFPISDLKLDGKEKVEGREARVFTYKVSDRRKKTLDVILWVDPLTRLPLKRVGIISEKGMKGRLTELYTGIKIDEKLDAKQFELPK